MDSQTRKPQARAPHAEPDALQEQISSLTSALAEKDAALRHLMQHVEAQKQDIANAFLDGIEQLVLPMLVRLRDQLENRQRSMLDAAIANLKDLSTPFVERLGRDFAKLSPTEVRICSLVRQGLSVKEVAAVEGIAASTVGTHRRNIRRKLGLGRTRVNLASFLTSRPDRGSGQRE